MLRHYLFRLFNAITRPIYARLKHDLDLDFQQFLAANLEEQEKFAAKILDELIRTRLELEKAMEPQREADLVPGEITDEEISDLVNKMTSHMRIVELACENGHSVKPSVSTLNETDLVQSLV